jgi:hypothetical protein
VSIRSGKGFPPRHIRKADQEWELAGCARQDGDKAAELKHTERARLWHQGIDPDIVDPTTRRNK